MPDFDQYARQLLQPRRRESIYRALNPYNCDGQDNCPSAAQALFEYLNDGLVPTQGGSRLSGRPADCPEGEGFVIIPPTSFSRPSAGYLRTARRIVENRNNRGGSSRRRSPPRRQLQLLAIIEFVRSGQPGNHVVIECIRPPSSNLAPHHYASLVKIGPPEDDVYYADCSRPFEGWFFPSGYTNLDERPGPIEGFLLHANQQISNFRYTRGPFQVRSDRRPQRWRSGSPKQDQKNLQTEYTNRVTDDERGLWV